MKISFLLFVLITSLSPLSFGKSISYCSGSLVASAFTHDSIIYIPAGYACDHIPGASHSNQSCMKKAKRQGYNCFIRARGQFVGTYTSGSFTECVGCY